MIIDTLGQFQKLCPSYSRSIDLTPQQQLEIVNSSLDGCRTLSARKHWAYDLNRHLALKELAEALKREMS